MHDTTTADQPDAAAVTAGLVEEFQQQLATWCAQGRVGLPLLVLPDAAPARWGWCISCGGLAPGRWRCFECLEAVTHALELEARAADVAGEWARRRIVHARVDDVDEPAAWWDA